MICEDPERELGEHTRPGICNSKEAVNEILLMVGWWITQQSPHTHRRKIQLATLRIRELRAHVAVKAGTEFIVFGLSTLSLSRYTLGWGGMVLRELVLTTRGDVTMSSNVASAARVIGRDGCQEWSMITRTLELLRSDITRRPGCFG